MDTNKPAVLLKDKILSASGVAPVGGDGGDIDAMLREVSIKAMEPLEAYKMGYAEGQKESILRGIEDAVGKSPKDLIGEMSIIAEVFYSKLRKIVPQEAIKQLRIGVDNTTKTPVTLAVISYEYEKKVDEIMDMGIDIDLHLFHTIGYTCSFGVITDHRLDQGLIEHDFPWYREDI